ncbi:uncharacterized protein PG998_013697 [Apiospora kogelbergensis]|uniref:uncharacterized protein n=1 Tax=Apiospora kogelbergensis TaxID=1337665 RepID=UPI003131845B
MEDDNNNHYRGGNGGDASQYPNYPRRCHRPHPPSICRPRPKVSPATPTSTMGTPSRRHPPWQHINNIRHNNNNNNNIKDTTRHNSSNNKRTAEVPARSDLRSGCRAARRRGRGADGAPAPADRDGGPEFVVESRAEDIDDEVQIEMGGSLRGGGTSSPLPSWRIMENNAIHCI